MMPVGFGFSAGDFIAGIGLIGTIINCLKDASNPSLEYQELIRQLYSLQSALIQVKNIKFDGPQHAEAVALWQAASHCHQAVDEFWTTIQKYQPHLREGGSGSLVKDSWRKVKWATCKKGDLAKFKSNLSAHTAAIQLLLNTLQLNNTSIQRGHQSQRDQSLAGKIQDLYFACMQGFSAATTATSDAVQKSKKLLNMVAEVLSTSVKTFQIVLSIQKSILSLPYQVERQQPVYLIDALGKAAPFHLEFVRSAEALKAVLKINFQKIENCAPMIERGNFAIQDAFTKRDIDLNKEWDVCFLPGQKVEMSMVFTKFFNPEMRGCQCPHCLKDSPGLPNEEAECTSCGMTFRHLAEEDYQENNQNKSLEENESQSSQAIPSARDLLLRKREESDEADIAMFRRVRVTTIRRCGSCGKSSLLSSDGPGGPGTLCDDCGLDFLCQKYDIYGTDLIG